MILEVENIKSGSLLYFDTDSLVYYRKMNDPKIEFGGILDSSKIRLLPNTELRQVLESLSPVDPKTTPIKCVYVQGK